MFNNDRKISIIVMRISTKWMGLINVKNLAWLIIICLEILILKANYELLI